MKWWLPALAAALLLAGCDSDDDSFYNAPKALDKMSPDELCSFYAKYLSNPNLSVQSRAVAQGQMQAKGCAAKP